MRYSYGAEKKVFSICEAKMATETNELLQTGTDGHQRIWQNAEKKSDSRRKKSPSNGGNKLKNEVRKEKNYEKGVSDDF